MRKLQKLRNRPSGVSIVGLAIGQKVSKEDELNEVCTVYTQY
jgi:hypothetical protein